MDELIQILAHKQKIIGATPNYKEMDSTQKEKLLDELLIEKKKQSLRVLIESRLQQAVASRHFRSDQEITEIIVKSYTIMNFRISNLKINEDKMPLEQLVQLYIDFFTQIGHHGKVQQIQHMFYKRVCPKSLLPATLFNWLVEYIKKQFKQYLKRNIHSLYVNSRKPIHNVHKVEKEEEKEERENEDRKSQKYIDPFMIINRRSLIGQKRSKMLQMQGKKDAKDLPKSLDELRIGSSRNKSEIKFERMMSPKQEYGPINKEVYMFAFADQFQKMYKGLEDCIPDLEANWARKLKKGSARREEVLRRIPEVASSCIKQMNHIKQSIDSFYHQCKPSSPSKARIPKKALKTESIQIEKPRSENEEVIKKRKKRKLKRDSVSSFVEGKSQQNIENQGLDKTEIKVEESREEPRERPISTSQYIYSDRRGKLLSSLSRKYRYDDADSSQYGSQSNLIATPAKGSRKNIITYEMNHQTIDLSLNLKEKNQSSRILWLNSGRATSQLQIIEERVKKMKMKVLNGKPIKGSVFQSKSQKKKKKDKESSREHKTIDFKDKSPIEYRSLPVTIDHLKEQIKLPKIKKNK